MKKYLITFKRFKNTPDTFRVVLESHNNRPRRYSLEMRLVNFYERFPRFLEENGITFNPDKIQMKRNHENDINVCGDCIHHVYDANGFHFCRKSGLRTKNENECNHVNAQRKREFKEIEIYKKSYWKNLVKESQC